MIPLGYHVPQRRCQTCRHALVIRHPDGCPDYYCRHDDQSDPPPTGLEAMGSICLPEIANVEHMTPDEFAAHPDVVAYNAALERASQEWDDWADIRQVDSAGVCDQWSRAMPESQR